MALTMSSNPKSQESTSKPLRDLASIAENRLCFDCGQRGPTYVNMSIGSFVCTRCGGALRKYNQRVKSISMSNFTTQDIQFLKRRGNKACSKIVLGLCDGREPPEKESSFDDYLRLKYQVQKWYRSPNDSLESMALRENELAISVLSSRNANLRGNHISANAAVGLIIPNNRSFQAPPTKISSTPATSESSSTVDLFASVPSESKISQLSTLFPVNGDSASGGIALVPDPFSEFVAARPATAVPQQPFHPSNFAVDPFKEFQFPSATSPQPQSITKQPPVFPVASSQQPAAASVFPRQVESKLKPPPSADKYAALAELDRMGKVEEEQKNRATKHGPSYLSSFSPVSFSSFKPSVSAQQPSQQQANPFHSSAAPSDGTGNPFASAGEQSNAMLASTSLGRHSFNPFVVCLVRRN